MTDEELLDILECPTEKRGTAAAKAACADFYKMPEQLQALSLTAGALNDAVDVLGQGKSIEPGGPLHEKIYRAAGFSGWARVGVFVKSWKGGLNV